MSNYGIKSDDNLVLLLNAINRAGRGRPKVMFDEYHHGYGESPGIMSLIGPEARLGLAQLGMAFLLLLFAVSRRFGRPILLRENVRFRSEYLSSMALLLRKASALDLVVRETDRKFRADICRWLGLPPDASRETITAAVEERRPDKVREITSLLESAPSDEKSVMALQARRIQLRKELTQR